VLDDLKARGLLLRRETKSHTYPFCWRCDTLFSTTQAHLVHSHDGGEKTRSVGAEPGDQWYPSHIREGRFGTGWRTNRLAASAASVLIPTLIWALRACARPAASARR